MFSAKPQISQTKRLLSVSLLYNIVLTLKTHLAGVRKTSRFDLKCLFWSPPTRMEMVIL